MASKKATVEKIKSGSEQTTCIPADIDVTKLLEDAKQAFYTDDNVCGVGIGARRRGDVTCHDEVSLIVYVKTKRPEDELDANNIIPKTFQGIATDIVEPFSEAAPKEALGFAESHQHSDDMANIDWPLLHEQWQAEPSGDTTVIPFHGKVRKYGDVCAIEDDGTLVKTVNGQQVIDYVRAYKMFRQQNPDIYDYVTFFTDTPSGMPPQGGSSWYRFVYNDTQGIGFGPYNQRASFGSNKLQGIMFLNQGHIPVWRYVMLQEQAHRWCSFARYSESSGGAKKNDHMLNGWGHWSGDFDDDDSAMDYDQHDWVEDSSGNFRKVSLDSEERGYCNLDLYLMGLLGPTEVGDFSLLSNVTNISGNLYSANKKRLTAQNVIWAEGNRVPSVSTSQKLSKNAFVVLTKSFDSVHDLVNRTDELRLRFEHDFFEATKHLAKVDTTLGQTQIELTPSQVSQLTSGNYTSMHKHIVRTNDLKITGTQFSGSLNPGQTQKWFTYNWSPSEVTKWSVRPTTAKGKVKFTEEVERSNNGKLTYWLTIKNVGSVVTSFEAKYARMR